MVVTHRHPIAFITTEIWGGSYPRVANWLIKGFNEIGYPYDAVFLEGHRGIEAAGRSRVVHLGRRRARWGMTAIATYLRRSEPIVALIKPPSLAISAITAGMLTHQPVVPWEPSFKRWETDTAPGHPASYFRAREWTYTRAPALAAVTTDVADALRHEFGDRLRRPVTVIPNPIDVDDVRRLSAEHEPAPHEGLRLCAVGRLAAEKGYDVLLQALALASPSLGTGWRLQILGKGPRQRELMELRDRLNLADHVDFLGWVENPYPIMAAADVFVHPARFEPFGIVYTEALALGVPVIATTCPGGPNDIFSGGDFGRLVPPDDPRALADAIIELREDGELRRTLAEKGPARAGDFTPAAVASRMVRFAEGLSRNGDVADRDR